MNRKVPRIHFLLIAAGLALASTNARAQVTGSFSDPLSPTPDTDPRQPPHFERITPPSLAQSDAPSTFTLRSDAIGKTGFDSTNARKKRKRKAAPKRDAQRASDPQPLAEAPPPAAPSPYQQPVPPLGASALAAAPGEPPVDYGPIRKPPKKRKAHSDEPTDPYAPLGLRLGSFLVYPAIEVSGGYSSNPSGTPNGKGAALYSVEHDLHVQSDWSRHELTADLRGSYTGYSPDETPTLSRPNVDGKVAGRIDVSRDTNINLDGHVLVSTDNPGSPNLQAGLAKLPVFATYGGDAGIAHRFNRLEISVKGGAERTVYQDSQLTDGSTASNADRQYNQYGGTLRGSYELTPGLKPFVEVEADKRVHDTEFDFAGFQRNSKGASASVGSTFELTHLLTGEISVGYARRTYEDPRLDDIAGLIGNASLIWTVDALNTVKFTAASSIGESTLPGVPGVFYRDIGLQYDHSFRRWLIGSVKLGVGFDTYKNGAVESTGGETTTVCSCTGGSGASSGANVSDRVDTNYSAGIGLTYKLNRQFQINGEFRQDWLRSNVEGVDYTASTVLLGVRWQH
jgi:hypothetical protein